MLLLRLTSPESVIGLTSDDGFEIGVVTAKTLSFILGMTFLGAGSGVLYAALRARSRADCACRSGRWL